MKENKVWLITGAGSGIGLQIAKAALAEGHKVVATGRDANKVSNALDNATGNLLVVKMDVTNPDEINTGVHSAIEKFGAIDILVNNAGNFYAGFFEELSQNQVERQIATNLFGPMNITRAVLPFMRKNKSGHIISISSTAALVGYELCSAYAASKFGLEGWMESLQLEVAPFGINTTIVEPGFFRTSLLEPSSTIWSELQLEDYAERIAALRPFWESMNGTQGGDPAKLAAALLKITSESTPPKRWMAGADSIAEAERKAKELLEQANAYRELSSSLSYQ
ncbi:NAD(P)-dependent dehydrogenase (short-subunit alcohol dehydrogenase family) [Pedobacter sp. W3I1]|uniref:SDR family oxidoreductase n=1 Tax=Pedobacter sp. W3I1 TaxID=3042291 RepID=UPI002789D648|nr:SDR family oxidoreductase [Pedobacter sp. W3I1]MDQ0640052.1 NAD(P)-dependent dehydrogenase (short-subunit alcohol dehydrogenase family) [Pedobacter sp. W3I1]